MKNRVKDNEIINMKIDRFLFSKYNYEFSLEELSRDLTEIDVKISEERLQNKLNYYVEHGLILKDSDNYLITK